MAGIFGHLNLSDSDRVYNSTVGQATVWQAVQDYVSRVNADIQAAMSVFVERTTSDHKLRYKLPGGGSLQRRGSDGRYGSVKVVGQWDVAFPLEDFGAQISGNDVDMAYMTVAELDRHVSTVVTQNVNTVRFELLKALLNKAQDSFTDPLWGALLIEPLANGDAVVYPPVLGSEIEAVEQHYIGTNYVAADISDTNNPFPVLVDELEEHFGVPATGSNIAAFINNAQSAKVKALSNFDPLEDRFLRPGAMADTLVNLPTGLPGTIIGRCDGCWVIEWRFMPANYMLGIHLDVPKPVLRRIDPSDTGLGDGLMLLTEAADEEFPFSASFWRHRFGLGVGNRLNGVAYQFVASTTYTTPTDYA